MSEEKIFNEEQLSEKNLEKLRAEQCWKLTATDSTFTIAVFSQG